jgi:hypothetical protein
MAWLADLHRLPSHGLHRLRNSAHNIIMEEIEMNWAPRLAYVTGTVNEEFLLRNEYLAAENRILKGQIKGRLLLSKGERATPAEIAHRLGRRARKDLAATIEPDTILRWYRKLIANKFD